MGQSSSDLSGRRLGEYELQTIIGREAMSTVYKAYQPSLHRLVAVKVLAYPGDLESAARFQREAPSIAALQHPNILPVFDYGDQDGQAYLVVQFVKRGRTLGDLLHQPMEPARIVALMERVLAGLGYAHEHGVVHRDVKPSKVLMASPTWPMLADFGIAKLMLEAGGEQLTRQGLVVGTAAYMAPEQAFGLPVDRRTDLYAAGAVLYEMVVGRAPFEADTPAAMLSQQAYASPPSPRELNPALSPELEAVVLRALAKEPAERFQSAEEMTRALQESLAPVRAVPAAPPDPLAAPYAAGVRAFSESRFDDAVAQLSPVAEVDPDYEDVESLLVAAQEEQGQVRGRADAEASAAAEASVPAEPAELAPEPAVGLAGPPAARPRSGPRRWVGSGGWRLAGGIGLAVAVMAAVWLGLSFRPSAARDTEVLRESAIDIGPEPFIAMPKSAAPAPTVVVPLSSSSPTPTGSSAFRRSSGTKHGLYGGTRNQSSCDQALLVSFLGGHRAQASAWVDALNSDPTVRWGGGSTVQVDQIPAYVRELTPAVLRFDTRVTNNGFVNGRPTPRQSVLQAGTAVLVDRLGMPRTRCACGNPLLAPQLNSNAQLAGSVWPGFQPTNVVVVSPGQRMVTELVLVDVDTGAAFQRPAGSTGSSDANLKLPPATVTTSPEPPSTTAEPPSTRPKPAPTRAEPPPTRAEPTPTRAKPPRTTAAPPSTTAAPPSTTIAPPSTTVAPASTTAGEATATASGRRKASDPVSSSVGSSVAA